MTTEQTNGASSPSASSAELERFAFEKWYAGDMPKSLERAADGTYKYMNAQIALGVWKAATAAEREACAACVPTSWLDPLLTGKSAVVGNVENISVRELEALLLAVKKRIESRSNA